MMNIDQYGNIHFLIDFLKIAHYLLCRYRIKRRHRLIRKNNLRILCERARKRHALLLSAGELIRTDICLI